MSTDMIALRAQLAADKAPKKSAGNPEAHKYFAFWSAPLPSDITVRFLPHPNPDAVLP